MIYSFWFSGVVFVFLFLPFNFFIIVCIPLLTTCMCHCNTGPIFNKDMKNSVRSAEKRLHTAHSFNTFLISIQAFKWTKPVEVSNTINRNSNNKNKKKNVLQTDTIHYMYLFSFRLLRISKCVLFFFLLVFSFKFCRWIGLVEFGCSSEWCVFVCRNSPHNIPCRMILT